MSMHDSLPLFANVKSGHLYLAHGCPFCHRIVAALSLTGLREQFSVTWMKNIKGINGWEIETGHDPIFGASSLAEVYDHIVTIDEQKISVPLLIDKQTKQVISASSRDIVRYISTGFSGKHTVRVNLFPEQYRNQIDECNDWMHKKVNRAVYLVGFSNDQSEYESRVKSLFKSLDGLEEQLKKTTYILGDKLTESDIYLLATLVRFDSIYFVLFKCSMKRIIDYPALYNYLQRMLNKFSLALTYSDQLSRQHYFLSVMHVRGQVRDLNPSRLIPVHYAN